MNARVPATAKFQLHVLLVGHGKLITAKAKAFIGPLPVRVVAKREVKVETCKLEKETPDSAGHDVHSLLQHFGKQLKPQFTNLLVAAIKRTTALVGEKQPRRLKAEAKAQAEDKFIKEEATITNFKVETKVKVEAPIKLEAAIKVEQPEPGRRGSRKTSHVTSRRTRARLK